MNLIIDIRTKKNLTQIQMAKILEVSQHAISRYENKKNPSLPRFDVLCRLRRKFKLSWKLVEDAYSNR